MPSFTIDLTEEQADLLKEHAIRNRPQGQPTDPKSYVVSIVTGIANQMKREKIQTRMQQMTIDEAEEAINDFASKKGKEI